MSVIERYILRRCVMFFLAALGTSLLVIWLTQVLMRIDIIAQSGQTTWVFLKVATLLLPSLLPEALPFSVVFAIAMTFDAMNTDSEFAVINSAGTSRVSIYRPAILLGLVASLASFTSANVVDPIAKLEFRRQLSEINADMLSQVIQNGTFQRIEDGLYVQIGGQLPGGDLSRIFVADSREEGIDLVYYSKRGELIKAEDRNLLVMIDGVINRKAPTGELSVIKFTSYAFDLSAFSNAAAGIVMFPRDRTLPYLLNPDPNDPHYQYRPESFRAEVHRRLTDWVNPLVFAMIALAAVGCSRPHRQASVSPTLMAVSLALDFRLIALFLNGLLERNQWLEFSVYLLPLATCAVCAWYIARNKTIELPDFLVDWVKRIGERTVGGGTVLSRIFARNRSRHAGAA